MTNTVLVLGVHVRTAQHDRLVNAQQAQLARQVARAVPVRARHVRVHANRQHPLQLVQSLVLPRPVRRFDEHGDEPVAVGPAAVVDVPRGARDMLVRVVIDGVEPIDVDGVEYAVQAPPVPDEATIPHGLHVEYRPVLRVRDDVGRYIRSGVFFPVVVDDLLHGLCCQGTAECKMFRKS